MSLEPNQKDKVDSGDPLDTATPSSSGSGLATVATFLDTPGQEIFYRMRTNGARVADAVLLVVSGVHGRSVCGAIGSTRDGRFFGRGTVFAALCRLRAASRVLHRYCRCLPSPERLDSLARSRASH